MEGNDRASEHTTCNGRRQEGRGARFRETWAEAYLEWAHERSNLPIPLCHLLRGQHVPAG